MNFHKDDFPIFSYFEREARPFVYLDSASTAQAPRKVLDAVALHEGTRRANVHRGIYSLSESATEAYEGSRQTVAKFVHARSPKEVIFTRNTTESINLIAYGLVKTAIKSGDHVLISRAEHHSNFLPWQMLRDERGIILDIVDVDERGFLPLDAILGAVVPRTKLAAFSHVSHVLGTINPVRDMGQIFRDRGILFFVDAAQSAGHLSIDVREIGCDFLAFSGHKLGGPMGIGVLWGREELLEDIPPFLRGGGMIREVSEEYASWDGLPYKFEAGTPNVAGAVGLAQACNYVFSLGFEEVRKIDEELTGRTISFLRSLPGTRIFGPKDSKLRAGLVSFAIDGIHPHDLATLLDRDGIAIRAGHHCAMPLMQWFGVSATARVSFWVYNSKEDIDALQCGIEKAIRILRGDKF